MASLTILLTPVVEVLDLLPVQAHALVLRYRQPIIGATVAATGVPLALCCHRILAVRSIITEWSISGGGTVRPGVSTTFGTSDVPNSFMKLFESLLEKERLLCASLKQLTASFADNRALVPHDDSMIPATTETAHVVAATLSAAPGGGGPTGRRTRSCGDPTTDDPSTMMVDRPQRLASVPRLHPSLLMVAHHHGSLFVPLPATPLSTRVSGRTAISPTAEHGAMVVDGRVGGAVSARLASADDVLAASFYTPSGMMTPPSTAATPTNGSSHMLVRTMRTPRDNNDPLPSARANGIPTFTSYLYFLADEPLVEASSVVELPRRTVAFAHCYLSSAAGTLTGLAGVVAATPRYATSTYGANAAPHDESVYQDGGMPLASRPPLPQNSTVVNAVGADEGNEGQAPTRLHGRIGPLTLRLPQQYAVEHSVDQDTPDEEAYDSD